MAGKAQKASFDNPSFDANGPPPPYHPPTNDPQTQIVISPPTNDTVGIFFEQDPIIVQPRGTIPTGPETALEYLRNVSCLVIRQKIELIEILTSFDTANRFTIFDQNGQVVFYALEDSDCCVRQCCGPARPFEMQILDIYQNEVVHIHRPLACQGCCCFCCLMNVEVSSPPGTVVGKVQQKWSLCIPSYDVRNAVGETVLKITGPCWRCACGGDIVFKILNLDGEEVGDIAKTWGGLAREYFTDADNFRVKFPQSLTLDVKLALLGAVFLIDVMYFERAK